MQIYLMVDFGSTFTKLTAIDLENKKIIGTSKSFTTIGTDVKDGYDKAIELLQKQVGNINFDKKYASSSAAGGLKMISVGLVPDLTAKASRLAATSAGAKVLKTYSYELTKQEQKEISDAEPDIVLLTGGIDGGNKEVILHNAEILADIDKSFSIIISGNKSASEDAEKIILSKKRHKVVICENVMPQFNVLNISPTKKAIRDLFIENIIKAKGLSEIQKLLDAEIIPTPLAVFEATELLSRGTKNIDGIGELMVYDVGGATTDVYSMADGLPKSANVFLQGMQEPFNKRTVEGDIGMRYSVSSLVDVAGIENIAISANVTINDIKECLVTYKKFPETVPSYNTTIKCIDDEFAAMAIKISASRHCGFIEVSYSPVGELKIQTGKDLTKVKSVIGTGGALINSENTSYILGKAIYSPDDLMVLKPILSDLYIDKKNIFAAMGLLSHTNPDIALEIMKNEFIKL